MTNKEWRERFITLDKTADENQQLHKEISELREKLEKQSQPTPVVVETPPTQPTPENESNQ
jgi:hypothetical protein